MAPLLRGVRSQRGFSLLWSLVYVVILASLVSTALVWSRYVLRVGGLGQIRDERNVFQSQASFDQAALQAMQTAAQQATVSLSQNPISQLFYWLNLLGASFLSWLTGQSLQLVTMSDLQNALTQKVFPALQQQQMQASIVYTYQTSWSQQLKNQISQLQNLANSSLVQPWSSAWDTLEVASFLLQAVLNTSPNYMQPHAVIQVKSAQGGYSMYYNVTYVFNPQTFQWVLQITQD